MTAPTPAFEARAIPVNEWPPAIPYAIIGSKTPVVNGMGAEIFVTPPPPLPTAHRSGHLYAHCPACNRPPHESFNRRCRRCAGFGYLIVEDRRFKKKA